MRLRYSGTRALIVGGSCEMGICLAEALVCVGITPMLTYRNDAGRQRIQDGLKERERPYESLRLDFSAQDPCATLLPHLKKGADYLIDLAQEDLEALVASADPDLAKRFFQSNIASRAEVIHLVARKMMAARQGRMVYISSTAAACPNPGQGFYAAAKQAGEALYRNVGLELAGRGISTVTLRPGYIDAGRGHRYIQENQNILEEKVPLGRALRIQEVVETIMFLLSDSATGINATAVTMDGGLSAGK